MRTTLWIDDALLGELMQIDGSKSRSEAIRDAIRSYVSQKRIEAFKRLAGSGLVDADWRQAEAQELHEAGFDA